MNLGDLARLKIDRYLVDAGGEMTLSSGPLLFDGHRAGVKVLSPFALIAVRGPRFFAGPSNDRFGVFVERGSVMVAAAGQQVTLREGEGTDIVSPGTPPTPVKRWGLNVSAPRSQASVECFQAIPLRLEKGEVAKPRGHFTIVLSKLVGVKHGSRWVEYVEYCSSTDPSWWVS